MTTGSRSISKHGSLRTDELRDVGPCCAAAQVAVKTGAGKRIKLWAGLAAVVILVGVLLMIILQSTSSPPNTTPDVGSSEAADVARALEKLESDPGSLLPPELESEFADDLSLAVPPGTTIDADEATWVPSEAGGGTIETDIAVPGEPLRRVLAIVAEYDDGWKILQTIELERG